MHFTGPIQQLREARACFFEEGKRGLVGREILACWRKSRHDQGSGIARDEFKELLGTTGEPQIAHVKQWPMGLPQTSLSHRQRLEAFANAERALPGLFLTGNYFAGPGVAHCVTRAIDTARRVEGHLYVMGADTSAAGCLRGSTLQAAAEG